VGVDADVVTGGEGDGCSVRDVLAGLVVEVGCFGFIDEAWVDCEVSVGGWVGGGDVDQRGDGVVVVPGGGG